MTISTEECQSYEFQAKVNERSPVIISGSGIKIKVKDPKTGITNEVIDAMTGAAVGSLGWGDDDVVEFMTEAAKETTYSYPANISNEYAQKLSKFYIDNSPPGAFAAALWTGSGSESNENAMKLIRQYWKEQGKDSKLKFISRSPSYHGYTLGALSIGSSSRSKYYEGILLPSSNTLKVSPCYPYRYQAKNESLEEYKDRLLKEIEDLIIAEGPETIAAIIVETLPGSSLGTAPPVPGYLLGIREICTKYDVIFMLDEVMCGTGRASPNGGLNCWENYLPLDKGPDIQTVGKTLGSGYVTIAGVLVSPKMKEVFVKGSGLIAGAQTYHCHAFNCFVALKIQEKIKKLGLTKNIFEVGNYMGKVLKEELLKDPTGIVGDVRGIGGFWSFELVKNKTTKEVFELSLDIGHRLQRICFENGVTVMGMQGSYNGKGDHVMIAPSYIITKEDADLIVHIIAKSVSQLKVELTEEGVLTV